MKKKELFYDLSKLSERIEDLRKGDGINKVTLDELSKAIENKTGEQISKTTLSNYENNDDMGRMRISNLIALANTYDVSIDYLLGKTNSKKHNYTDQMASNKYSLSDDSLSKLTHMTNNKEFNNNEIKLKFINHIIENDKFLNEIPLLLVKYYKACYNQSTIDNDVNKIFDISSSEIARYSLIKPLLFNKSAFL